MNRYSEVISKVEAIVAVLEPLGMRARTVMGILIAFIANWVVITTTIIGLVIQTARLTRVSRRVRKYLDLRMTSAKEEENDNKIYEAMINNTERVIDSEDVLIIPERNYKNYVATTTWNGKELHDAYEKLTAA